MTERDYLRYRRLQLGVQSVQEPYIQALLRIYAVNLPRLIIDKGGEIISCSYAPEVQKDIDELHRLCTEATDRFIEREKNEQAA